MKRAAILSFSERGGALAERLADGLRGDWQVELRAPRGNLAAVTAELFPAVGALIFVGACGIAVRAVAPLLAGKTRDPAVVVVDERGQHAISLLSGHIGGANALALRVAGITGGSAVITTATDVNGRFSVDAWAARHGLRISDMKLAKRFSAEILRRDLPLWSEFPIEGNLPEGIFHAKYSERDMAESSVLARENFRTDIPECGVAKQVGEIRREEATKFLADAKSGQGEGEDAGAADNAEARADANSELCGSTGVVVSEEHSEGIFLAKCSERGATEPSAAARENSRTDIPTGSEVKHTGEIRQKEAAEPRADAKSGQGEGEDAGAVDNAEFHADAKSGLCGSTGAAVVAEHLKRILLAKYSERGAAEPSVLARENSRTDIPVGGEAKHAGEIRRKDAIETRADANSGLCGDTGVAVAEGHSKPRRSGLSVEKPATRACANPWQYSDTDAAAAVGHLEPQTVAYLDGEAARAAGISLCAEEDPASYASANLDQFSDVGAPLPEGHPNPPMGARLTDEERQNTEAHPCAVEDSDPRASANSGQCGATGAAVTCRTSMKWNERAPGTSPVEVCASARMTAPANGETRRATGFWQGKDFDAGAGVPLAGEAERSAGIHQCAGEDSDPRASANSGQCGATGAAVTCRTSMKWNERAPGVSPVEVCASAQMTAPANGKTWRSEEFCPGKDLDAGASVPSAGEVERSAGICARTEEDSDPHASANSGRCGATGAAVTCRTSMKWNERAPGTSPVEVCASARMAAPANGETRRAAGFCPGNDFDAGAGAPSAGEAERTAGICPRTGEDSDPRTWANSGRCGDTGAAVTCRTSMKWSERAPGPSPVELCASALMAAPANGETRRAAGFCPGKDFDAGAGAPSAGEAERTAGICPRTGEDSDPRTWANSGRCGDTGAAVTCRTSMKWSERAPGVSPVELCASAQMAAPANGETRRAAGFCPGNDFDAGAGAPSAGKAERTAGIHPCAEENSDPRASANSGECGDLGAAVTCRAVRPFGDTLRLVPRVLYLGIGCRRGASAERIAEAVRAALDETGLLPEAVAGAASIDVKRDEPGLREYCVGMGIPIAFYSAEELRAQPGKFTASEFVERTVGVDNVCERAAMRAAGPGAKLLVPKCGANGVTVAIASAEWRVSFP